MKSIRYRRGRENERDLAVYTRLMAEDNGSPAPAAAPESGPGASGGGDGAARSRSCFYTITRGLPCGRLDGAGGGPESTVCPQP